MSTLKEMLARILRGSPPLAVTGWFNLALLLVMAIGAIFDHRQVLGIDVWFKPMKFAISIAIYVWTVAILLDYVPKPQRLIGWGISLSMMVEIFCIAGQSSRGVRSHFNVKDPFDAQVFALMGIMVAINTLLIIRLLWVYFRHPSKGLKDGTLWGIRFGLAMLIVASLEGGLMIALGSHTIGGPDGGPGLPFLNWSTRFGDLRVAHLLGLHALQILPLAGLAMDRRWPSKSLPVISMLTVAILFLFLAALSQALRGHPLLSF